MRDLNKEPALSGTMVNNMEDLVFLGKQMERMRDGVQLGEDMRFPDPIQYDDIEKIQEQDFKRKN